MNLYLTFRWWPIPMQKLWPNFVINSRPSRGKTCQRNIFLPSRLKRLRFDRRCLWGVHSEGRFLVFYSHLTITVPGGSRSRVAGSCPLPPSIQGSSIRDPWDMASMRTTFFSGYLLLSFFPWMPRERKGSSSRYFPRALSTNSQSHGHCLPLSCKSQDTFQDSAQIPPGSMWPSLTA